MFGYLVETLPEQALIPAIRTAQARHRELVELKTQASSLAEALEARKTIERAKGILMVKEGLTEEQAFTRLRKASQRSDGRLKVIADAVTATLTSG